LNAIQPKYETYGGSAGSMPGASAEMAVAVASHDALIALLPASKPALDRELANTLSVEPDDDPRTRGAHLGRRTAAAAPAARAKDGADKKVAFPPGTKPGEYRPTPPDETPAFMAQWGGVAPFALQSSSQFRPSAPPPPDSALALREVAQVAAIGG